MNAAYSGLADWFEYLNADCDYEKWSQYLYERLCAQGIVRGRGLDIGCGSGVFCRAFSRRGYSMTGYDNSEEMLSRAQRLAAREGDASAYILCDARRVRVLGGRADFALCVNDCLNYIPQGDVLPFFRRVASCLKKGGAFLFDVSSAKKLREEVAGNTFCEDREEIAWMWFNTPYADRVEMDVTLFIKEKDGRFRREDEHHTQYIHERAALAEAAEEAGFEVRAVEGAFGDPADLRRENFICVRR